MSEDKMPDIAKGAYATPKGSSSIARTSMSGLSGGSTGIAGKPDTQTGGKRPAMVMTDKMTSKLCK